MSEWSVFDSVAIGMITMSVAFGRCVDIPIGDDHVFATVTPFKTPAFESFGPMANYMAHRGLAEVDPRAESLPLVARVFLAGVGATEVGYSAPLELLPALIGGLEMMAAVTLWVTSPRGWTRVAATAAVIGALVTAPPERSLVNVLVVFAFAAMRKAGTSPFAFFFAGLCLVTAALSDAFLATLLVPWVASAGRLNIPVAFAVAWVVTLWQLAEAIGRADPQSAGFHLDMLDPVRYATVARGAWDSAVDPSLWSNAPHFGNSWQMYQLLFPRFARGTRIATALLSLIPVCLTTIATAGKAVRTTDSVRGIAAVAILCSGVFSNFLHPSHVLLAFGVAPELSLRIRFGFFILGGFVVLWPLLLAYQVAWLDIGSMPQPNMPFYGGSVFAFVCALYVAQLIARMVVEARVRLWRVEAATTTAAT